MKMKKIGFVLLICLISNFTQAQDNTRKSPQGAVYVELLGQGLAYSFNYDTRFTKSSRGIGGRIGIGGWKLNESGFLTVPVGINYLLGKGNHYFEIGAGATFTDFTVFDYFEEENTFHTVGTLDFGYRLQPADGGFSFRAGITPFFGFQDTGYFWPFFGGVSFGYAFK